MLEDISSRKHTGQAASNHLERILSGLSADDAYIIERIIAKDLKIGIGGNINKVIPGLIEQIPYQGAKPYNIKLITDLLNEGSVYCDLKMDGRYNSAIIYGGDVVNESRQGEGVFLNHGAVIGELKKFHDCVLNGELTIDGENNRARANGIITSLIDITKKQFTRSGSETDKKIFAFEKEHNTTIDEMVNRVVYTVWDMITLEEYSNASSKTPYSERWGNLVSIINEHNFTRIKLVDKKECTSLNEIMTYFSECLNKGLEGIIVKSKNSGWIDGKHNHQIKMKLEIDVDLEVIGFNYGEKGKKNEKLISSLQCKSRDGLLFTEPCGMDEKLMKYVTENMDTLLCKIVHVKSCGITTTANGNSLLHPRVGIQRFRDDKIIGDSLAEIIAIEDMVKGLLS